MIPSGAIACTVRNAAVFPDPRLVLPEMSRIRTSAVIRTTYLARAAPPAIPNHRAADWAEFARRRWLWLLTGQWTVFSLVILAPVAVLGPVIAEHDLGGARAWGAISSCLALGAAGIFIAAAAFTLLRSLHDGI